MSRRTKSLLEELAEELGLDMVVEPTYGYAAQVTLPTGERRYCRGTVFDLNGAGAAEVASDKDWASFFLARLGYPVPVGAAFFAEEWAREIASDRTPDAAWEYAVSLGLPVFVKPNSGSQGQGVSRAFNYESFARGVVEACRYDRVFLVQAPARGADFRIVVLDGDVMSAYERRPLTVRGDGRSTLLQLLRVKQERFRTSGRAVKLQADDQRITDTLGAQALDLGSVVVAGREVVLVPVANLSTGGDATDLTETLHPEWARLVASISRDMNLRLVGIDVVSEQPLSDPPSEYTLIEVNAAPGLNNYAADASVQRERVRALYRRVLLALAEQDAQRRAAFS